MTALSSYSPTMYRLSFMPLMAAVAIVVAVVAVVVAAATILLAGDPPSFVGLPKPCSPGVAVGGVRFIFPSVYVGTSFVLSSPPTSPPEPLLLRALPMPPTLVGLARRGECGKTAAEAEVLPVLVPLLVVSPAAEAAAESAASTGLRLGKVGVAAFNGLLIGVLLLLLTLLLLLLADLEI